MALVVANEGELVLLTWMLKTTSISDPVKLKLFKTDVTPSQSSTVASFTEADFTSYAEKSLARASWGTATTVSNKASISYASQTFTAGSSQSIYGYFVTNDAEDTLLWAEKFASVENVTNGGTLTVVPKFTLNSEA